MTSNEMRKAMLDEFHIKEMNTLIQEMKDTKFPAIKKKFRNAEDAAKAAAK